MYDQIIIYHFVFFCCVPEEKLVLGGSKRAAKKWDQEWDSCVLPLVEDDMPSYLLYRLDSTNNQGYEWIFLAWSPDHSPVSLFACCHIFFQLVRGRRTSWDDIAQCILIHPLHNSVPGLKLFKNIWLPVKPVHIKTGYNKRFL